MSEPNVGAAIGAGLFALLIPLALYVWVALALGAVFRKTGEPSWKAWVPILNSWTLLELGGQAGWWALLALLPVVNIVAVVFTIIALHAVNTRFGLGVGYTVLGVLVFPVWASIVGWGSARPLVGGGVETTGYEPRPTPPPPGPFTPNASTGPATPPAPASFAPAPPPPPSFAPAPAAPGFAAAPPPPAPPAFAPAPPPPPSFAPAPPPPPAFTPAPPSAAPAPPSFAPAPPPTPPAPPAPPAPRAFAAAPPAPAVAPAPAGAPSFAPPPPPPTTAVPAPAVAEPAPAPTADSWAPPTAAVPAAATTAIPVVAAPAPEPATVAPEPAASAGVDEDDERTVIAPRRRREHRLVLPTGSEVALTSDIVLLGRAPVATAATGGAQLVSVDDETKTISKTHSILRRTAEGWSIEDLGSTNGTALVLDDAEVELVGVQPLTPRFFLGDAELRIVEG
ncbi:DUF5684 domain-containing protein [Microbacterium sp. SORGH_AS_0888]|uniref:DUF5684 domain-containing protein n=1 Tax=Microbacterium sp. SORGH_AS_0888 TaxID=3041791 RepID=UPI0027D88736|nr:DUF5684 domain-containing protein [Microbacterium sp. SORGH_AS_0888]